MSRPPFSIQEDFMPWKLVGFIVCLVLGTCFAGFNLGNSCNISFGFKTFENVPIFFSLIVAFALGVIVTLPFTVIRKKSAKDRKAQIEQKAMKKLQKAQAKAAQKEAKVLAQQEKAVQVAARKEQKEAERRQKQEAKAAAANSPVVPAAGADGTAAGGSGTV